VTSATVRHVVTHSKKSCQKLIDRINSGASFAAVAKKHSCCPSSTTGGELGTISKGATVLAFESACFSGEIGVIQGPIKTEFGYHLIQVTERE